jgi:hypothetical protein
LERLFTSLAFDGVWVDGKSSCHLTIGVTGESTRGELRREVKVWEGSQLPSRVIRNDEIVVIGDLVVRILAFGVFRLSFVIRDFAVGGDGTILPFLSIILEELSQG